VIVYQFQDHDRGNLFRIDPSIVLAWDWFVIGFENKSIRVNEIDRELLVSIPTELVSPIRPRDWHQRQITGRLQDRQAHHDHLRHTRSKDFLEKDSLVEGLFELAVPEGDIQCIVSFSLRNR
jgi:hypothetical protein